MNRKTKYGWITLGGMLCLFGGILACKVRDGNKVVAQAPTECGARLDGPDPVKAPAGNKKAKLVPLTEDARPLPPISGAPLPAVKTEAPPLRMKGAPPPAPAPAEREILIPASATILTSPAPPPPPVAPPLPSSPSPTDIIPAAVGPPPPNVGCSDPLVAPRAAPVRAQLYRVRAAGETLKSIARVSLGSSERCDEVQKLNPGISRDVALTVGTVVRLPMDATLPDEVGAIRPLPMVRIRPPVVRPKVLLPLTGTYQVTLDDSKTCALPKELRAQLGNCDTVMISPGTDRCLWLTNHAHLERMGQRLDQSPAREADVRNFKRLYYAQAVKTAVATDGKVTINERLATFGGLSRDIVLVGIDDHFELWDVARWRRYTQQKARAAVTNRD